MLGHQTGRWPKAIPVSQRALYETRRGLMLAVPEVRQCPAFKAKVGYRHAVLAQIFDKVPKGHTRHVAA